jgi:hypothetical protein
MKLTKAEGGEMRLELTNKELKTLLAYLGTAATYWDPLPDHALHLEQHRAPSSERKQTTIEVPSHCKTEIGTDTVFSFLVSYAP